MTDKLQETVPSFLDIAAWCDEHNVSMMVYRTPYRSTDAADAWRSVFSRTDEGLKREIAVDDYSAEGCLLRAYAAFKPLVNA